MLLLVNSKRSFSFALAFLALWWSVATTGACRGQSETVLTLEVVRAFDSRLPVLSDADMREVIAEGQRQIASRLAGGLEIRIRDRGSLDVADLFRRVTYRETDFYKALSPYRYDRKLGAQSPIFRDPVYQAKLDRFLRDWSVKSLAGFYPGQRVRNYAEAREATLRVYHERIGWLGTLRTAGGAPLVLPEPVAYQSYTDWLGLMYAQKEYDIVFTNTLIVLDTALTPYPHSITKHAKVGGSSFDSPAREAMGGRSLLVNTIEEFGGVPGLSRTRNVDAQKRNRLVGAILFAHEFAHAFYLIPDVYDHPPSCLMNSNFDNLDLEQAYEVLVKNPGACPKCQPYVESKSLEVKGRAALRAGRFREAGEQCRRAADILPEKLDSDRAARLATLRQCARDGYARAGDVARVRELEALLHPRR